jgi:hypothetical protein
MLHLLLLSFLLAQDPGKIIVTIGPSEDALKTASWHDLHVPSLRSGQRAFKIIAQRGQQPLALKLEQQQVTDLLAGQIVSIQFEERKLLVRLSYVPPLGGRTY